MPQTIKFSAATLDICSGYSMSTGLHVARTAPRHACKGAQPRPAALVAPRTGQGCLLGALRAHTAIDRGPVLYVQRAACMLLHHVILTALTSCCNCKRVSAVRITWWSNMHAARCTYNTGPRSMAACARSAPSKQSCPVRGATTAAGMSCAHLHAWQGVVRGTTQSSCHRVPGAVLECCISKIMVHAGPPVRL